MPLINDSYDSLPYVDSAPSADALAAARSLIDADLQTANIDTTTPHPSIAALTTWTPQYTPALEQEHARLLTSPDSRLTAIDTTRYETLSPPPPTSPSTSTTNPALQASWTTALHQAYASSEYVSARLTELGLLEKFGKNAWLIGNAQLEDVLRSIEAELAGVRKEAEGVEMERRAAQEQVRGELEMLGETWKKGVGRVLEAEVAAEGLKGRILERRREGVQA